MRSCFIILLFFVNVISIHGQVNRVYFSDQDKMAILNAHNSERKLVGTTDLTWDNSLEEFAASWALILANRDNGLSHRPNNRYGENCYWTGSHEIHPEEAILAFNEEKHNYQYGPFTGSNFIVTGHYTQVVWYRTTRVGCAAVNAPSGIFVVCNYDPPGNLIGDYPYRNSIEIINPTPNNSIQNNRVYPNEISRTSVPTDKPSISSVLPTSSNLNTRKSLSNSSVYMTMLVGADVWTKFENSSILPRLKSIRKLDFTGSSPCIMLKFTLPRGKNHSERDVRGFASMGVTMNNQSRQKDVFSIIKSDPENYRVYAAINYELGLQFFKYLDLGVGQLTFGNLKTTDKQDNLAFNRLFLRCALRLGNSTTLISQIGISGEDWRLSNWNMAVINLSFRSRFF